MSDSNIDAPRNFPEPKGTRATAAAGGRAGRGSGSRSFRRVDGVLEQVVRKLGLDRRLREQTLINLWPHLLGEPWARRSRALFIDSESNLVVALADAATGQELSLMKPAILAKVRLAAQSLGVKIAGLRFDLKHFHGPAEELVLPGAGLKKPLPQPKDEDLFSVSLSDEERVQVEELRNSAAGQTDAGSQCDRLAALFERRLRLRRWRQLSGYPACSACAEPVPLLHGPDNLCAACFYRAM